MTSLRLPCVPTSVGRARAALLSELELDGTVPPQMRDNAALVLSELLANAVRHAEPLKDGQVLVSWRLVQRTLSLSVSDGGGDTEPKVIDASLLATGGRGLAIVEQLALRWWREMHGSTFTVHADLLV